MTAPNRDQEARQGARTRAPPPGRGGAAAPRRRHLHGSVRSPRAPQARRSTPPSTASRRRLCARIPARRRLTDAGECQLGDAQVDGGPRGGWRTAPGRPRAGRPRQRARLPQRAVAHASVLRAGSYAATQHAVVGLTPGRPPSTTPRSASARTPSHPLTAHACAGLQALDAARGRSASTGVTWPHPLGSTLVSRRWPRHAARRCACPDGTSTMTIARPSGSRATISMRPQGLRFGSSSITTSAAASRRHSRCTSRT
jgi:hypothetical protein